MSVLRHPVPPQAGHRRKRSLIVPSAIQTIRCHILELGRWSVLLCLFSVSINKPATGLFIALALLCSALGERSGQRLLAAVRQPVVIGCLIWLAALCASTLYAPPGPLRWEALRTGIALLYPLIIASLLDSTPWRTRGLLAFGLAVCLIVAISWAQFFGVVPQRAIALQIPSFRYTVFHDYTQQGLVSLILAALAASFARVEPEHGRRIALWAVAAAAAINVIFLLQSRTSYLVVAPLLLYWVWLLAGARQATWRGIAAGLGILLVGATLAAMTPRVQERLLQAQEDVSLYAEKREATSMGIRLELWKRTLPIIASAPLLGHGLGQWPTEFQAEVKDFSDYDLFKMGHPHQEALLILAEQGALGLAIFVALLIGLGRHIARLSSPQHDFFASLLLIYITAGLANCLWVVFAHRNVFMLLLACIPLLPKTDLTKFSPSSA